MARHSYSRRLHRLTLWLCAIVAVFPSSVVQAGGGLAAIDAFHVGRYHLTCGDRHKALDSFNDALKLNPQFVQAYIARGKLLAEMGEFQSALADLNFALRLQPTHAEGFAYRGFVLLSLGKPQESLPEFDMALRLDPSYARVHYLRGQALRGVGNEMGAESSIASALQLDPSIETLQVLATTSGDDGTIGVRMTTPAGLERTSQMADTTFTAPPELSKQMQGRVVRFDQHPQLANLNLPFAPAASSRQPHSQPQPPLTARQPSVPPPHPKTESEAGQLKTVRQPGAGKLSSTTSPSAPGLAERPEIMPPLDPAETAAAIFAAAAAGESSTKPTPEASEARISESIASTQQSVEGLLPSRRVNDQPSPASPASLPIPLLPPTLETPSTIAMIADASPQPESMPAVPAGAAVERANSDAELCRIRGIEREEQGDPTAALREYENAIRLDPTNPQTYCLRGRLFMKGEFTKEAVADFEKAVQLAPGLAIGYYGLAHARYLQRDFANAIDDYNVVLRLDDCHAQALIERGHCLAHIGEAEKAEVDRQAALVLDPSLAKAGPKYGDALPKAPVPTDVVGPTETPAAFVSDAPAKIERATGDEPAKASAFGDLFRGTEPAQQPLPLPTDVPVTNSTDGVATASDRVDPADANPIDTQPGSSPSQPTAAEPAESLPMNINAQPTADDAANQELKRLSDELSRAPGDANLYVRRAEASLKLGRAEDAVDDLNAALRIEPNFIKALALRADAHEATQRLPAAVADLNELLRLKPNDGAFLAQRGGAKLALGLVQEAEADLTQSFANGHNSADAYCRRGLANAVLGKQQEAMTDFAAALEREPSNAEIFVCRGRAFAEFNRPVEALADFNRAVELNPKLADAYFERSRLYAARGAYEKSQDDRHTALKLDPTLR